MPQRNPMIITGSRCAATGIQEVTCWTVALPRLASAKCWNLYLISTRCGIKPYYEVFMSDPIPGHICTKCIYTSTFKMSIL